MRLLLIYDEERCVTYKEETRLLIVRDRDCTCIVLLPTQYQLGPTFQVHVQVEEEELRRNRLLG